MENELGAILDLSKSFTVSSPSKHNPLVLIKKLNFNNNINEIKEKSLKTPERPVKKFTQKNINNCSINNNANLNNTVVNTKKIKEKKLTDKNKEKENNILLKSMRNNKFLKDKTDFSNTSKDFFINEKKKNKKTISPPFKRDKNCLDKIEEYKKNEKNPKQEKRKEKKVLRGQSCITNEKSDKYENFSQSIYLHTISENGGFPSKKKNDKNEVNNFLPKILNLNKNLNFSQAKNSVEKNISKDFIRKSYCTQNFPNFRRTSHSVYPTEKSTSDNPNLIIKPRLDLNININNENILTQTNRYTSVMKTYRDKKLYIFDKNKFYYVKLFLIFCYKIFIKI